MYATPRAETGTNGRQTCACESSRRCSMPDPADMTAVELAALLRALLAAKEWTNPDRPLPAGEVSYSGIPNMLRRLSDGTGFVVHRLYLERIAELLEVQHA